MGKNSSDSKLRAANQQLSANEQQLRAANQQLAANEQQLRAANQQLQANEQQLRAANQQLQANEQQLRAANRQLLANEKELKESEQRFDYAMKASQDGIWDWNISKNKVFYSHAWKKILNIDEESNSFDLWKTRLHPDDRDEVLKTLNLHLENKTEFWEMDHRLRTGDGNWIWVKGKGKVMEWDSEKNPVRMVGTMTDITDRKKAEQEIKKHTTFLNNSMEYSPFAMWIADAKGTVLRTNKALRDTLKLSDEQIVGKYNVFDDKNLSKPDIKEKIKKVITDFEPARFEVEWSGEKSEVESLEEAATFWIDVSLFPIQNADGELINVICQWIDITDRKQAEEKLRLSQERLQNTFDLSPSIIAKADLQSGHFIEANKAVTKFLGYSVEEFTSTPFMELIHPDDRHESAEEKDEQIKGKEVVSFENRYLCKDGTYKWIAWFGTKADKNGIVTAVGTDITEKKKAEAQIKTSEEKFRNLYEKSPFGIAICQMIKNDKNEFEDFIHIQLNESVKAHTGVDLDLLRGKKASELIDEATLKQMVDLYGNVISDSKTINYERHFDVYDRILEVTAFPLIDDYFIINFINITERKKAEEALKKSETKLKNIIENSTNLFYIHNAAGELTFISPQVKELLGYEPEEVMQKWKDFITDNPINDKAIKFTENALSTGKRQPTYELEMLRKDGKKIIVEVRESPVSENGNVISIVGSLTDISERKEAEDKIRESEAKFRSYIDNAPDGIFIANENGKYLEVNKAACDITGYTEQELLQKYIPDLLQKSEIEKGIQHFKKVKAEGFAQAEIGYVTKSGKNRFWEIDAVKLSDILFLGFVKDITARRKIQEEIKINEQRYRTAQEIGHVGNWEYNLKTTHFWGSDEAKKIYGFDPGAKNFTTDEVEECIPERENVHRALMDLIEKDKPYNLEFEIITKTKGESRIVHSIAILEKDEKGDPSKVSGVIHDITERKKAENIIRESEEKLRLLIDNSPLGICINDLEGNFILTNPAYENMLGYTKEELSDLSFFDITHPDYHTTNRSKFNKMTEGMNNRFEIQKKYIRKDGSLIDVLLHAGSIRDSEGNPTLGLAIVDDITEKNKVQARLIESETLFRNLFQKHSAVKLLIDPDDGRIVDANEAAAEYYGWSQTELRKMKISEINTLSKVEIDKELQKVRKRDIKNMEFKHKLSDGSVRDVSVYSSNVKYAGKDMLHSIIMDITERKKAEEKLKESEQKYKLLLDNINDLICEIDINGNYTYLSQNYKEVLGYEPDDLLGKPVSDLIHPEDLEASLKKYEKLTNNSGVSEDVWRFLHKDGSYRYIESKGRVYQYSEDEKRTVVISRDITDSKNAESKMKKLLSDQKILLDNDPSFIIYKDTKNNIIKITDTVAKMTNLPKEEIEGKPSAEIYPTMADQYYEDDKEVLESGVPKMGYIEQLPTSDGSVKWLLTDKVPVKDENENIIGIIVFSTDITDLKKTQDALQEREQKLQRAEKIGKLGHVDWVVAEQRSYWSDEVFRIYEREPELDVPGYEEIMKLHTEEDAKRLETAVIEALQNARDYDLDLMAVMPSGKQKTLHIIGKPVQDDKGNITNIVGTVQDISDRIKAEEEIRRSRDEILLKNKISNAFVLRSEEMVFNKILKIVLDFLNCKFGYFGYITEQQSLICPSMTSDIWDKCRMSDKSIEFPIEVWGGIWGESLKTKKSIFQNEGLSLPDGHVQLRNALAVPIIYRGKLIGQIVVADIKNGFDDKHLNFLEDICSYISPMLNSVLNQKRHEEELQRISKMESLGVIAGGIAHNFKNILTAMALSAEIAKARPEKSEKTPCKDNQSY